MLPDEVDAKMERGHHLYYNDIVEKAYKPTQILVAIPKMGLGQTYCFAMREPKMFAMDCLLYSSTGLCI